MTKKKTTALAPIKPTTTPKAPKAAAAPKAAPEAAPKAAPAPEPSASKGTNAALKAWATRRAKQAERVKLTTVAAPKTKAASVALVARRRK